MGDFIGIRHVSKTLENAAFAGHYVIISIKEYVKMFNIQSNFGKNLMVIGELHVVQWMQK